MRIHVCGVQKYFFFNFYFLAPIQEAPKSNIKKKVDARPTVYLWIGKSETKKSNGLLKRKVAYVTITTFLKKSKKKNGGRLKNSLKKMAYFPAVFWVNKILNLYFLA